MSGGRAAWISVVVACGCGTDFPDPFESDRGAYAEFLEYGEIEDEIESLERRQLELYVAIQREAIGTAALESLLIGARQHGVPVRAWLLLSDEDGYWPGAGNVEAFDELVRDFWSWNRGGKLGVEWIAVDMEPPLETSNELAAALESGDLTQALPVLLESRDPEAHALSREAWANAVDGWHEEGMKIAVTGLPFLLDDYGDNDDELQDMFDSPIDGIDWDEIGFLVYQNLYIDADGQRLGAALIDSYARTTREQFGDKASIALGGIGTVGKNTTLAGYEDPSALEQDIAAATAVGIDKIHLFSVDGMLEEGGIGRWAMPLHPDPSTPQPSQAVADIRNTIAILDSN